MPCPSACHFCLANTLAQPRCQNQTTLTKLATRVAALRGELAYVEGRLAGELAPELRLYVDMGR